jgi:hypothetical protein
MIVSVVGIEKNLNVANSENMMHVAIQRFEMLTKIL